MRFNKCLRSTASLFLAAITGTGFAWTSGELKVDVTKSPMNIKVSTTAGKTLVEITKVTIGTVNITSLTDATEKPEAMTLTLSGNTTLEIAGIEGGLRFKTTNPSVSSVMLTLKDQGESFFGITQHIVFEKEPSPDFKGKTNVKDEIAAHIHQDEDAEVYSGFYYTTLGYAGFFDHFAKGAYTFGVSGATNIMYEAPFINWYVFYGPSLAKIQKNYYKLIGAPKKVPMWACGPLVWHDDYTGGDMMVEHAKKFTETQIPYSTMWLDRPYNNGKEGWSNMNFEAGFAHPEVWIKQLNEYYVHLVTWIMPGVFSGTPPAGAFTSSKNQYLDLTDPNQVKWYKDKIKTGQYAFGVEGHKLDRIDNGWECPIPPFKDGTPAPERHKKYAFLNCKISDEMLREGAGVGEEYFLFPRCAVAGCQKYTSAIWNGDTWANWPGMLTSLGNAIRAGFLGFPMWGSDICGYKQKAMPQPDNYCRWLGFGVYSGFMELMLDGKEPWKLNAEMQTFVRNLFNLRFALLPYIYSIVNTSADYGVTMMPLIGVYTDDPKTIPIVDEYLFGPYMLVAPITTTLKTRSIYLPEGKWINVYNFSDEQAGKNTITCPEMALDQVPVYIKSNAIYPTGKVFAGLAKKWETDFDSKRTIDINVFPGAAGESTEFTYIDYIDGNKAKVLKLSAAAGNAATILAPAMTVPGRVVARLLAAPTSVYLGSTQLTGTQYQYDAAAKKLIVPFPANQPVAVGVNGAVKAVVPFEPAQLQGRIAVRSLKGGVDLSIPRMTGLHQDGAATVAVFNLSGKRVYNKEIALNRCASTRVVVALGKGAFIVKILLNGAVSENAKIIVP